VRLNLSIYRADQLDSFNVSLNDRVKNVALVQDAEVFRTANRVIVSAHLGQLILPHATRAVADSLAVGADPVWVLGYFLKIQLIVAFNAEAAELLFATIVLVISGLSLSLLILHHLP
jgi:hypothetical protein